MDKEDLAPGIRLYALKKEEAESIAEIVSYSKILSNFWYNSGTHDGRSGYRNSKSFGISVLKGLDQKLFNSDQILFKIFNSYMLDYQSDHLLNIDHDSGYDILSYSVGDGYGLHCDQSPKCVDRVLSAIMYVNEDYEGGELEFPKFKLKIKPQKGTLLFFPSCFAYEHESHPVKSGEKNAIVTFFSETDLK
jgi:hypothetical protein